MLGRLAGVARPAQPTPVPGVVGVEALLLKLPPAEGVMVSVDAGRRAAEDAGRMLSEDARPEAGLVSAAVAALPGAASTLLGF